MNERILKLINAATIQEGSHGAFGEPTINEYVDLEKFANLLIQDVLSCYDQIDNGNKVEGTDDFIKAVLKRYKGKKL